MKSKSQKEINRVLFSYRDSSQYCMHVCKQCPCGWTPHHRRDRTEANTSTWACRRTRRQWHTVTEREIQLAAFLVKILSWIFHFSVTTNNKNVFQWTSKTHIKLHSFGTAALFSSLGLQNWVWIIYKFVFCIIKFIFLKRFTLAGWWLMPLIQHRGGRGKWIFVSSRLIRST